MDKIIHIKTQCFVNGQGHILNLRLGYDPTATGVQAMRWSFMGINIPMPVRSGTWFHGFSEEIMFKWLKENGWEYKATIRADTGVMKAILLACNCTEAKGTPATETEPYQLSEQGIENGNRALKQAIRMLCKNGWKLQAISLYRLVYPCSLLDAKHAVEAIVASETE